MMAQGKWEARIGALTGRKYQYLGLYSGEDEAAVAYDEAAIRLHGLGAVTNFSLASYSAILSGHDTERAGPAATLSLSDASTRELGPAVAKEPSAEASDAVAALYRAVGLPMAEPPAPKRKKLDAQAETSA